MDLKLSVTRRFSKSPSESIKSKILESQDHKCKFCGIDIKEHAKFEEIKDNKFVGLCSVCYSSQHLESLPPETSGTIIMLPNISQLEIIALSRMITLIRKLDAETYDEDIDDATMISMLLQSNKDQAEIYFANGASEVELIAQVLSNQDEEAYGKRDEGLFNLKWLPDYTLFEKEIDYWFELLMKDKSSQYHPSKWESMNQKLKEKLAK